MKLVKKKRIKKRLRIFRILWMLGLFGYLGSSVCVVGLNSSLATEIVEQDEEVKVLQEKVNILKHTVNTLSNRERIAGIVKNSGLESNPDRVISVVGR